MFGRPRSVVGYINQFEILFDVASDVNFLHKIHGIFYLLVFCNLINWIKDETNPYCYDNVFADIALENGVPSKGSIYGLFDLFTWDGYIGLWMWIGVRWILTELIISTVILIGFIMFSTMVSDLPFCLPTEIDHGLVF